VVCAVRRGLEALTDFAGGAQDAHLAGGAQQVCERIATELGETVILESPVSSIAYDAEAALVTSQRRTVRAG
jgi:monoamine oxidase